MLLGLAARGRASASSRTTAVLGDATTGWTRGIGGSSAWFAKGVALKVPALRSLTIVKVATAAGGCVSEGGGKLAVGWAGTIDVSIGAAGAVADAETSFATGTVDVSAAAAAGGAAPSTLDPALVGGRPAYPSSAFLVRLLDVVEAELAGVAGT